MCLDPFSKHTTSRFSCSLCRTYANLEEDVEVDELSWEIDVSKDEVNNKIGGIGEGENAGAAGSPGPAQDGGEDDGTDVDPDRPGVVFEEPEIESAEDGGGGLNARNGSNELSPPFEGSGEDDANSDIGAHPSHPQHRSSGKPYLYSHAVLIPYKGAAAGTGGTVSGGGTNPGGTFVNNANSAVGLGIGLTGLWRSPGAGSSASARGDSHVPMNLGGGDGGGGDSENWSSFCRRRWRGYGNRCWCGWGGGNRY